MSYLDDSLLTGETLVYRAVLHKIVFFWPAVFFLYGLSRVIATITRAWVTPFGGYGVGWFLLAAIFGILARLKRKNSEFGITNRRVIVKIGAIRNRSMEILLPKIEGIEVKQSMLGRMFDYGTIVINGTGGTKERFRKIEKPFAFRKQVQEQIAAPHP